MGKTGIIKKMMTPKFRDVFKKSMTALVFLSLAVCVLASPALGQGTYAIDPGLSAIKGSIRYTVIGRYHASFSDYNGVFKFDSSNIGDSSVRLTIRNDSIKSAFPILDNIVRSRQLLDVKRFPETVFRSKEIRSSDEEGEYVVIGDLTLHGITREITFPFMVEYPDDDPGSRQIRARGVWVINRKDYDIIWNRILDRAGILVGNHMTVDWEIVGFKTTPESAK